MPRARRLVVITCLVLPLAGCSGGPTQPEPTKLSEEAALVDPPKRPPRTGPFRNPDKDPPEPRGGAQLAAPELEAAIAQARELVAAKEWSKVLVTLHPCANKEPASPRCDGELGMAMLEMGTRKAHGVYFLDEAAKLDDPLADAAFYRRIAEVARRHGRHDTAALAMARVLAREPDGADDWIASSRALQADEARIEEAIQALDEAIERKPDLAELRFERAVLIAQTPDTERAIAAFDDFVARAPAGDPAIETAKARVVELRQRAKREGETPPDAKAAKPDGKSADPKALVP